MPQLQIISKWGAGVDGIDVEAWRRRGVVVSNTPDAVGAATADLAVLLALAASRRLVEGVETVRSGDWSRGLGLGVDLSGSHVGIVGMGNIGIQVARRMRAFDCQVTCPKKTSTDEPTDRWTRPLKEMRSRI